MSNTVDILVRATTSSASSAMTSLMGVVESLYQDVKKLVDEYSNYAYSIGKAAQLTGTTAEEMSRLVQAADDAFVSQEALTRSFQLALKNGFVPTIQNVAKLSDELLAMENPAERAEKASKIFGRGWAEIAPFLLQGGKAIRDGTAAIADGLVVTDEAVAENLKYKASVDNLNDQFQALSYTAGKTLVPALTQVLIVTTKLMTIYDREVVTAETLEQELSKVPPAYREIERERLNNIIAGKELLGLMSRETEGIAGYNGALERVPGSLNNVTGATENFILSQEEFDAVVKNVSDSQERLRDHAAEVAKKIAEEGDALRNNLSDAVDTLNQAQQNWNSGAGNDFKSALEAQGLKGKELVDALAIIDRTMGTNMAMHETYRQKVEDIAEQFADGKLDAGEFQLAVGGVKNEFQDLDDDVIKAKDALLKLREQWEYFKKNNQINLTITYAIPGQVPVYVPPQAYGPSGSGSGTGGGYTPPPSTIAPPPTRTPVTGPTPFSINVNNNVDASKVASLIALEIQRRR